MNSGMMSQCADLVFANAMQDLAAKTEKDVATVRSAIIESPAFEALHNFETGLWKEGPDYFVSLINNDQLK